MSTGGVPTIRDTPLGDCIGATIVDITADDTDAFVRNPEKNSRVYFHLSNGETIFCTVGTEGSEMLGMLGTDDDTSEDLED